MEHSKLVPLASFKKEKLTIFEIANLVISFYGRLAKQNDCYSKVRIISERASLYQFIDVNESKAEYLLAEEILNQNIDDIKKINKIENPDIHFSRDNSILFSLESKINQDTLSTLSFCFTTSKLVHTSIGSIVINKKCFDSFEKSKLFLETVNNSYDVKYSVIKISDRALNRVARTYKAPLGWISYFSNDYEINIPNDLEGIEYEFAEKGKYLILTRENLSVNNSKDSFYKDKLLQLMEEIKHKVPEYSKVKRTN